MAKKPRPEGKKYSYMDTYGDLVTLLMCFFVLLFAMSTVEENKYNAFAEALSNHFGPQPVNLSSVTQPPQPGSDYGDDPDTGDTISPDPSLPADFQQLHDSIAEYIEENGMEGDVSIEMGANGTTFLRLSDNLLFAGDSSALRPEVYPFLTFLGEALISVEGQIFQVQLIGHTGSIPGSARDDWVLSSERSGRVASYLERQVGLSPYLLKTVGYGRHYPIADNNDFENGLPKNRRVDIIVIGNNPETLLASLAEAANVYFPSDDTQFFEGAPEELPGTTLDAIAPAGVDLANLSPEQIEELLDILHEIDAGR